MNKKHKKTSTDWTEADQNGNINVPSHLEGLFNFVTNQLRFHTISGKNEVLTVAHIVKQFEATMKPMVARINALESKLDLTKLSDYEDYIKNINELNIENRKLKKDIKNLMSFANQVVRYTSTGKDLNETMHNLAKETIEKSSDLAKEAFRYDH